MIFVTHEFPGRSRYASASASASAFASASVVTSVTTSFPGSEKLWTVVCNMSTTVPIVTVP